MAVFAEGAEAEEAKAAGADIVGGKELIEEIASNELISFSQVILYIIFIDFPPTKICEKQRCICILPLAFLVLFLLFLFC